MDDTLRAELIDMFEADQEAVKAFLADAEHHRESFHGTQQVDSGTPWPYVLLEWQPPNDAPPTVQRVVQLVQHHTNRLREVVAEHGWPGRSLVGEEGADAAWLILQHSGSGVTTIRASAQDLRQQCLELLRQAVVKREIHPRHYAAAVDGERSVHQEPTWYATLTSDYSMDGDGSPVFRYPVDGDEIDQRRASIGLPPLSSDVTRRARGEWLIYVGPHRCEPWPVPPDSPYSAICTPNRA